VSYALTANVEILISDSDAGLGLTGNTLNNTISGGAGDDRLNGGRGVDNMSGGAGNDTYLIDDRNDVVTDTSGTDIIVTAIDYTLGDGIETLRAGSDRGLILAGNDHGNSLVGRAGHDVLTGGLGRDILTGGTGDDVFKYLTIGDSRADAAHRDVIADFNTGDKIDLSAIDAIDGGGHDAFSFIGGGRFTAAGQLRAVTTAGGDTLIQANTGGTFAPDFAILLQGTHALSAADFVLS
jgi:Ca2+-binding RTX toxin-like protein